MNHWLSNSINHCKIFSPATTHVEHSDIAITKPFLNPRFQYLVRAIGKQSLKARILPHDLTTTPPLCDNSSSLPLPILSRFYTTSPSGESNLRGKSNIHYVKFWATRSNMTNKFSANRPQVTATIVRDSGPDQWEGDNSSQNDTQLFND